MTTPEARHATFSTTPLPDPAGEHGTADEHIAEVHPIVPAARTPVAAEVDAPEAATA